MLSWLRLFGLRVAVMCTLVSIAVATQLAAPRSDLPLALLDSFDQAFALAYDAAERQVAALEATRPAPARPVRDVFALLDHLADQIAAACDAATAALDVELVVADALPPERRSQALGCIEHHLGEARHALRRTSDPAVRAEYELTCDRLRDVRRLI